MRHWSGGCALVALILSWNLSGAGAAERIAAGSEDDTSSTEGVLDLTSGNFLSFVSQGESAGTAYGGDYYFQDAPNWTIWAGAIFLHRETPESQRLVTAGGADLLNASGLNFGTEAGPDLNAIRHGDLFDVDFRYFQVDQMSAHHRIFPPGGGVTIDLVGGYPPIFAPTLDAFYVTSIQSVEGNLRKNISSNVTLLAGVRYISLRDSLGLEFDTALDGLGLIKLNTDGINRMVGGQVGVDANVWTRGRFQFQSALKAGVYGNSANNALRLNAWVINFALPESSITRSAWQASFVGDWNFTGVVQITDTWAIRGGYQLLWLSRVALASEQYPVLSGAILPLPVDPITSGSLFLHGALVSLQAGW